MLVQKPLVPGREPRGYSLSESPRSIIVIHTINSMKYGAECDLMTMRQRALIYVAIFTCKLGNVRVIGISGIVTYVLNMVNL